MTAMATIETSDRLLRAALLANAEFSLISGLVLALFSGRIGDWIGAPRIVLLVIGLGLIPWGAYLFIAARRDRMRRADAWLAIVGDDAWVSGTLVLVLGFPTALTTTGNAVAIGVAIVVAGFAIAQFVGLRRISTP